MTWQQHLKKCGKEWREMKLAKQNAEKAKKANKAAAKSTKAAPWQTRRSS